eukprot:1055003-Amphidinium_carterae.1
MGLFPKSISWHAYRLVMMMLTKLFQMLKFESDEQLESNKGGLLKQGLRPNFHEGFIAGSTLLGILLILTTGRILTRFPSCVGNSSLVVTLHKQSTSTHRRRASLNAGRQCERSLKILWMD